MQVGQERGVRNYDIVYKFRRSRLDVLHTKYICSNGNNTKTPLVGSCFNKITGPVIALK